MFPSIFKIMWFEFLKCQVLFWLFPIKRVANTVIQFWCAYCHSGIWWPSSLHHAFSLSKSSRWKRSPLCGAYGTVRSQTWFIYFVQTLQLCLNSRIIQHTKSSSADWIVLTAYTNTVCCSTVQLQGSQSNSPDQIFPFCTHLRLSQGVVHWFRDVSVQWREFKTKQGTFGELDKFQGISWITILTICLYKALPIKS